MKKITPLFIHEQGLRENNEDSLIWREVDDETYFFSVCDGIGGARKGEVASDLACQAVAEYIQNNKLTQAADQYFNTLIESVDSAFDNYFKDYPETRGMGTTLALLMLNNQQAYSIHIGDSRVYHIRNHQILFQTKDHSLVNQLIDNEIITPKEAENHPRRNVITRAIQGKSVKISRPDWHLIADILPGDYFFLCTDGILESVTSELLLHILNTNKSDEDKIKEIKECCKVSSRDNYTAILIRI